MDFESHTVARVRQISTLIQIVRVEYFLLTVKQPGAS